MCAYPHVGRSIDGGSPGDGSAALRDGGERKASQGVPSRALASPLVEPFLLLFLADLDLCLAATAAGLIPAHAGLEKLRALRCGEEKHEQTARHASHQQGMIHMYVELGFKKKMSTAHSRRCHKNDACMYNSVPVCTS